MPHIPDTPFYEIDKLKILSSKQEVVIFKCKIFSEEDDHSKEKDDHSKEKDDHSKEKDDHSKEKDDHSKEKDKTLGFIDVLFKIGDDLRKDQIVLQVFKLFDELCKSLKSQKLYRS